jgi:hypothetical protein
MLLSTRVATLVGSPRRTLPWAVDITNYINGHFDLDISLWHVRYGYPLGTMVWSSVVESQTSVEDRNAKLLVDDGYLDRVDKAQEFIREPPQDFLRELIHGQPGEPPGVGAVATITTATAAVDRLPDALGWAVDTARYVTDTTGVPVSVLTSLFGRMGELTWISVQSDIAASDATRRQLNGDASYIARLGATKDIYLPGSAQVMSLARFF